MPIELKIPEVGESITEVQMGAWLKAEGDAVAKDEPVVTIDSEKTTFDLPAPEAGTLAKILHQTGDTVAIGTVIAHLEAGDAPVQPAIAGERVVAKPADRPTTPPETAPAAAAKPEPGPKSSPKKPSALPATR